MDQQAIGADGRPQSDQEGCARPSFVKFPCKAGTVVIYDNFIYHNALSNTSGKDRCALITSYQPLRLGAASGLFYSGSYWRPGPSDSVQRPASGAVQPASGSARRPWI